MFSKDRGGLKTEESEDEENHLKKLKLFNKDRFMCPFLGYTHIKLNEKTTGKVPEERIGIVSGFF